METEASSDEARDQGGARRKRSSATLRAGGERSRAAAARHLSASGTRRRLARRATPPAMHWTLSRAPARAARHSADRLRCCLVAELEVSSRAAAASEAAVGCCNCCCCCRCCCNCCCCCRCCCCWPPLQHAAALGTLRAWSGCVHVPRAALTARRRRRSCGAWRARMRRSGCRQGGAALPQLGFGAVTSGPRRRRRRCRGEAAAALAQVLPDGDEG
jgi:hypothetical protein